MLQNLSFFKTIFNDAPQPWQIGFQDSAAPLFLNAGVIHFHVSNIIIFLLVLLQSYLIVFIIKKGLFGLKLQKNFESNSIIEYFLLVVIVSTVIFFFVELLFALLNYFIIHFNIDFLNMSILDVDANTNAQDPVRWWPSGVPQTWSIMGIAAAIYRTTRPRVRAVAALSSMGITIPLNIYFHAVENPHGFRSLMYSWYMFKSTGAWSSNIPSQISRPAEDQVYNNVQNAIEAKRIEEAQEAARHLQAITQQNNGNTFMGIDNTDLFDKLNPNYLFDIILKLFRPVEVEGYLDELISQQLVIQILLLVVVISLISFFLIFLFIQVIDKNKELIIKKFNNRFILFYIKYQLVLLKISYVILPLFILFGLLELFVGLYFILTHPIPYEHIGIDLHTYIKKPE